MGVFSIDVEWTAKTRLGGADCRCRLSRGRTGHPRLWNRDGLRFQLSPQSHIAQSFTTGPRLQQVQTDEIKLAGAQVPDNLDAGTRAAVKELIGEAFIFGFRIAMFISQAF